MTNSLRILFVLILFFNNQYAAAHDNNSNCNHTQKMKSLVDVDWLKTHLNDPDLVILDASVIVTFNEEGKLNMASGEEQYNKNHIPNTVFADLLGELSAKNKNLNFVMPTPAQFQKAINNLGISNSSQVVIYSSNSSESWAQRVWWMLKWAGHDNMAILDGGLKAWIKAGFPTSDKIVNRIKTSYKMNVRENLIADRNEVFHAINDKNTTIIDALPESVFNGSYPMYIRPGHIQSAINIPASSLITDSGSYKTTGELKTLFNSNPENRVITYCGGGISASSIAFALDTLGHKNVSVYMGSLQEWATNNKNPMSVLTIEE